jgi:hypothetical protein
MLHTHLHLHAALTRRTNGRSLRTFLNTTFFRRSECIGQKSIFTFFLVVTDAVLWTLEVSSQWLSAAAQVRSYASPCEIWVGQSSTVTGLFLSTFFFSVLLYSPVRTIPPMIHSHLHLHKALTRRTNGQSLGTFLKSLLFRKPGNIWILLFLIQRGSTNNSSHSKVQRTRALCTSFRHVLRARQRNTVMPSLRNCKQRQLR